MPSYWTEACVIWQCWMSVVTMRVIPLPGGTQMFAWKIKISTAETAAKECWDRAIWKEGSGAAALLAAGPAVLRGEC